jgi:hypothetical protein
MSGDLRETHSIELKQETGLDKGSRSEIARDLASLALDGGTMIIGIAEAKETGTLSLHPVPLEGRVEALDQISDLRVEPPLSLTIREIVSESASTEGYLIVEVHASPSAPHMVDGVYYGRGEKRRRRLSDAEVVRLHRSRQDEGVNVVHAIEADAASDPFKNSVNAHLFLVALPVSGSPTLAADIVWDRARLSEIVRKGDVGLDNRLADVSPNPRDAHRSETHEHGLAATTVDDSSPYESGAIRIALHEDGGIHLYSGRLSDSLSSRGENVQVVFDVAAVAHVHRLLRWALAMGAEVGYTGAWDFALLTTGMKGIASYEVIRENPWYGEGYPADRYLSHTRATRSELVSAPEKVSSRLLGRLLRTLKSSEQFSVYLGK